ncbi:AmpG family muropeptide MFS transporter [Massilia forsythiae]|uniref:AmpG family muropeptide MFS transporter n=1 Tax=Massilia forsythiae TaxID=2728020 RepID=A0A7Z2VVI2_9BURK|nr:MFS transporter [Massilia forsythiae]QJE00077.1 AmpG family muropeptide MFS transporter [Massilia forsythiae]
MQTSQAKNPWLWVPSLYFGQAIPYIVANNLSVIMYKDMGVSNADIAFYTSLLYLPWVIKPLWSPLVDLSGTKRGWTVLLQLALAASLGAVGATLHLPAYFMVSLGVMWLMAFASATHDIAADGFYMLGLRQQQQAAFVGVRSTFYRLATLAAQGPLVILTGYLASSLGDVRQAWAIVFFLLSALFLGLFAWHQALLPRPEADHGADGFSGAGHAGSPAGIATPMHGNATAAGAPASASPLAAFIATFASFFRKRDIWLILGFILTFRLGEAQLLKLVAPFLKDPVAQGGLGLSNAQYGTAYGTIGIIALTGGGLFGGWLISRLGLKRCLWLMVFAVHLPDLVFVYLSSAQPQNLAVISGFLAVEQFGYGFGFTAMLLYMIMVADGPYKTAHYALCTGLMALGMMVPGMWSGKLQEMLGYRHFFIWTCLATVPAFVMAALVKIDPEFGKK